MSRLLNSRYGGVFIFYMVFLTIATGTRFALLGQAFSQVDHNLLNLAGVFLCGALFDLAAAAYASVPYVLLLTLMPRRWFATRFHHVVSGIAFALVIYVLLFGVAAEWFFWDEFQSRFNFIAVDYLVYTTEVIGNIRESYPLPLILGGLGLLTAAGFFGLWKTGFLQLWFKVSDTWAASRKPVVIWLALPVVLQLVLANRFVPGFGNAYNQELARNGMYSFCAAFWDNSLDYDRFYPTLPMADAFHRVKGLLAEDPKAAFSTNAVQITRRVTNPGPERNWNVIQITVESLSAKFLGRFGGKGNWTPNLDRLFDESLVFTNLYATGTRTVRGMEALTLSLPPTPGQSIVRRPNNGKLFSTGALFREHGYDTAFIYSGYGYFDNMNAFFAANGYRVIDRNSVRKEDITYATVWGACDEDLYRWALREADETFAAGKPFHQFVMTTSNHRPFGFPAGRIDLPIGKRAGAMKYTDYAIGKFLAEARTRPWFTNTLFVIVGDHCASAAGKTALPIDGYHIPALVWNPGLVAPRHVGALCSQIDLLPTIFGLMDWSYDSRFYGRDILHMTPDQERAYIATYQKLGYFRRGKLAVLEPMRQRQTVTYDADEAAGEAAGADGELLDDAIAEYQTASYLFSNGLNQSDEPK